LAAALGLGSLAVKDESSRFGLGSYKVLGASWAASRLAARATCPDCFSAATAGNHGKAVAWVSRQLGKTSVVFVPSSIAPQRLREIQQFGAEVIPVEGGYDDALRACIESSAGPGWQVVSDAGFSGDEEIPNMIMDGYRTLFREADWQRQALGFPEPTVVMLQAGVGGLAGAAVRHFLGPERASRPALVVVEPAAADCHLESILSFRGSPTPSAGTGATVMAGLDCPRVSTASWPEIRRGVRLFLSIEDQFAERAMRVLFGPLPPDPPITAGASGAAGLAGLLALLECPEFEPARRALTLGPGSHVLAVNTEGDSDRPHFSRVIGA
jgi:diaminopropionate ammonia-lyase